MRSEAKKGHIYIKCPEEANSWRHNRSVVARDGRGEQGEPP